MHISDFLPKNGLFDSHCHLEGNIEQVMGKSRQHGVSGVFNAAIDIKTSKNGVLLAQKYPDYIKTFIGIDPQVFIPNHEFFLGFHYSDNQVEDFGRQLEEIYSSAKEAVIGIGETGMDFYWIKDLDQESQQKSKSLQLKLYEVHLQLATQLKLPLTIHSRGAEKECLEVIVKNTLSVKGIFHSFTGNYEIAKAILDSGNGLGVNGIITFKNANDLRDVYKKIVGKLTGEESPEFFYQKGIFFETDSPFLAPEGKRGETNYPYNVKDIFEFFVNYLK